MPLGKFWLSKWDSIDATYYQIPPTHLEFIVSQLKNDNRFECPGLLSYDSRFDAFFHDIYGKAMIVDGFYRMMLTNDERRAFLRRVNKVTKNIKS